MGPEKNEGHSRDYDQLRNNSKNHFNENIGIIYKI